MPHMDKAQTRGASQRHDDRMCQTVQTGVPGRKCLIDRIARCKILRAVQPAAPRNTAVLGRFAVHLTHAAALAAPQLLHGQVGDILVREAELIHPAHHIQMLAGVADQFCLPQQQLRVGGQRAAMGVIPHAVLAHPDGTHARVAHKLHGAVGHPCARPQQQHRDACRRDGDHSFFIRHGDGTVLSAKGTVFQIQKGHPVLYLRQCLQVRPDHARHLVHLSFLRA